MGEIESVGESAERIAALLGTVNRGMHVTMLVRHIEARDNAVAYAARLEFIEGLLAMRHAQVPYPLREYLQAERAKYAPKAVDLDAVVKSTP